MGFAPAIQSVSNDRLACCAPKEPWHKVNPLGSMWLWKHQKSRSVRGTALPGVSIWRKAAGNREATAGGKYDGPPNAVLIARLNAARCKTGRYRAKMAAAGQSNPRLIEKCYSGCAPSAFACAGCACRSLRAATTEPNTINPQAKTMLMLNRARPNSNSSALDKSGAM